MAPLDVAALRRDTPGCERVLHFNNAGSSLPPGPVVEAQLAHLRLEAEIGGYEAADRASERVDNAYTAVAALLGASRDEIAVVENATRAFDMAFYAFALRAGDRILCSRAEYASNYLALLQATRRSGAVIEVVPSETDGRVSVSALRESLARERARLVVLTHVPTNGGLVNPAREVGRACRESGVPLLLDACQSAGQMPLDVAELGCDVLSATARKFLRGPRGVGFLYVRRGLVSELEPPFADLHAALWAENDRIEWRADARRFENWESNIAAKIGLGVAADYARSIGLQAIQERVTALAARLRDGLGRVPGVSVLDLGPSPCAIVTFDVAGRSPVELKAALGERCVNVSVTTRSSTRLDMEARGLESLVRASVHYYNLESEVDRFCEELAGIVRSNR
ncbi:MAG TPA: aminotransferase class V-fold PLP-dependent enzyme [Vicinamibacteria bacterium]|jgi:selenocysteine lyase/cysteine desulfurase